jgi:hypothetical protein
VNSSRGAGFCPVADRGRTGKRVTAEDDEAFITSLCAMPPGPERDQCVRHLIAHFLQLYSDASSDATGGPRRARGSDRGPAVNAGGEAAFLLAAVREAVERTSIRAVAKESGVSHGGIYNFANGRTRRLYGTTLGKLRNWYLRQWASGGVGLTSDVAAYLGRADAGGGADGRTQRSRV